MASDALPADAWASTFGPTPNRPLLTALQRRLAASTTHVHALAELFHERAAIEHEYATKLGKLVRAAEAGQLSGKGAVEWDRHSGEAKLWDAVLSDIQETASSHLSLSSSLKSDFEMPIRDLPNKSAPWRRIHDQEASLDRTLKDAEKTAAKLDKAASKRSTKTDQLQSDLHQLNASLGNLAPQVYTTFQRLDEERLRTLKEVIVRWSTARADVATRDGERAEAALTKLLSWETQDEVIAVGNRLAPGGPRSNPPSSHGHGSAPQMANANDSTPRRPSAQTAGSSELTPRTATKVNGSSNALVTTGGGGGFSGFKSMLARKATVSGRQRSGSEATSMRSNRRTGPQDDVFAPLDEREDEGDAIRARPVTPQRQQSDNRSALSNQPPRGQPMVDSEGYSIAPADRHKPLWDEPNEDIPTTTNTGVALPSAIFAEQRSSTPDTSRPSSIAGSSMEAAPQQRLNLSLAQTPIQESEEERTAALAKMQQMLQATPGAPVRRSTIARGRREARNTMLADSGAMQPQLAALSKVGEGSTATDTEEERLSDNQPLSALTARSDMGRRESVSSVGSRNPFDSPGLQAPASAVPALPTVPAVPPVPAVPTAAGAATGLAAGAATAAALPAIAIPQQQHVPTSAVGSPVNATPPANQTAALSSPTAGTAQFGAVAPAAAAGLQATMVETVHALIRQFISQRTVITGEIHLSFLPSELRPAPTPGSALHIRLTNFEALETILPNPDFLAQVPDAPGEYYLNVEALAHATAAAQAIGTTPVLFKYHVLVPEGAESTMIPLALNPAFQIKDGETRMILHYRAATPNIANLNLAVSFPEEPAVTATQSKPFSSTWSPADGSGHRIVHWEPSTVHAGEDAKVVARFVTSPGAARLTPTSVNARFALPNHLVSGLGIEIVENAGSEVPTLQGWSFDGVRRSTVSGKYVGDATINP